MIKPVEFLKALAKEIRCRTDPDLTLMYTYPVSIEMVFFGSARTGWVKYVDLITVTLYLPICGKRETIRLDDPKSFQRMEKIHDDNWEYV